MGSEMCIRDRNRLILFLLVLCLAGPGFAQGEADLTPSQALSTLPVQSGGRMKPLDTLARESVRLVTGKTRFEKQDPVLTLMQWWADPEKTRAKEIIEFRDLEVKKELGLAEKRWFSYDELSQNQRLDEYRQEIHQHLKSCLLYTSPSPRDLSTSRMPSSA